MGHQGSHAIHLGQSRNHLIGAQDNRQAVPSLDSPQATEVADLDFQHVAVEEEQGIERLGLGGGSYVPGRREVIDEGHYASGANRTWMLAAMEMDVSTNPEPVSLLGSATQMPAAADHGHLVHEPKRGWGGGARFTP